MYDKIHYNKKKKNIIHFKAIANGIVFTSFPDCSLLVSTNMSDFCELLSIVLAKFINQHLYCFCEFLRICIKCKHFISEDIILLLLF